MIALRSLVFLVALGFIVAQELEESKCSCGVFSSKTSNNTNDTPIIMKNPNFAIDCDGNGKDTCAQMCIALAKGARDKAPQYLCEKLGTTTEPFTPQVYSKSCDDKAWISTGLKSAVKICCSNQLPISCGGSDGDEQDDTETE